MIKAMTWVLCLSLLGWLAGCGGSSANSPSVFAASEDDDDDDDGDVPNHVVNARGSGTLIARIGPPGGSLELSIGPRIVIPPGAVEGGVDFVLKKAPLTTAFANDEAEKAAGPTFLLSPYVEAPKGRMIEVSIPMASMPAGFGDAALAYEYEIGARVGAEDSTHTRWEVTEARISGGRLVAEVEILPGMRLQFSITDQSVQ